MQQHCSKLEEGFKQEVQANNERIEERIDDILLQIQCIVSGLEDSLQTRLTQIEDEMTTLAQNVDEATNGDRAANEISTEAKLLASSCQEGL